jgi:hypothetical protein
MTYELSCFPDPDHVFPVVLYARLQKTYLYGNCDALSRILSSKKIQVNCEDAGFMKGFVACDSQK